MMLNISPLIARSKRHWSFRTHFLTAIIYINMGCFPIKCMHQASFKLFTSEHRHYLAVVGFVNGKISGLFLFGAHKGCAVLQWIRSWTLTVLYLSSWLQHLDYETLTDDIITSILFHIFTLSNTVMLAETDAVCLGNIATKWSSKCRARCQVCLTLLVPFFITEGKKKGEGAKAYSSFQLHPYTFFAFLLCKPY